MSRKKKEKPQAAKEAQEELTEEQLDDVAGGAGIDYTAQKQSGLRVQLEQSREKTTTGTSFSEIAASGLSKDIDPEGTIDGLQAPKE